MDLPELDAQLDLTAGLVERLVAAPTDDPDLMAQVTEVRHLLERRVPEYVGPIRERFQSVLGTAHDHLNQSELWATSCIAILATSIVWPELTRANPSGSR